MNSLNDATYDPTWLVDLAKKEYTEEEWLHEALEKCTKKISVDDDPAMIYFVHPTMPSQGWEYKESISLGTNGSIVIDILKDGRVGSIELVWLIEY